MKNEYKNKCVKILSGTFSEDEYLKDADLRWICEELIDMGYIRGKSLPDRSGIPSIFSDMGGATLSGKIYLENLERKIYEDSILGKIERYIFQLIPWFGGVISAIIVQYFTK